MSTQHVEIRPETSSDVAAIRHVNQLAFGQNNEADLVDALRAEGAHLLSLVAQENQTIVGHILFCRITIELEGGGTFPAASLSPMAVLPKYQNHGIGSQLVLRGLELLRAKGETVVTVLGHPEFYARFGFVPAYQFNIACPYEVPSEAWMLMELTSGVLAGKSGAVAYPAAFDNL